MALALVALAIAAGAAFPI